MKFFKIENEKAKNFFTSLVEADINEILQKTKLNETLNENGIELLGTEDCDKSNFKVISNFGGKKGCIINVVPVLYENEIVGGVAFEKERCSLLCLDQLSTYRRTYESQRNAFDWVI